MTSVINKARDEDLSAKIEALADSIAPGLSKAILDALEGVTDQVTLKAMIEALETGNVSAALDLLSNDVFQAQLQPVKENLENAVFAGGALAAANVARFTATGFIFERLNPRLIDWLNEYSFDLIRQIGETTREGIRDALVAGMQSGEGAIATARKVRPLIGLTKRQGAAVGAFRKELETFHTRSSAKGWNLGGKISRANGRQVFAIDADGNPIDGIVERRLRDFRFDGSLKRAMASGKPLTPSQIDKMVAAYARKYRRYRSEMIARTEAIRTTNVGVQDAWRQAIEDGKIDESTVVRRWIVTKDERLCPICSPIPSLNKEGVGMGEAFATPAGPVMLPPVHPACRCTVFIRSD